MGLNKLICLVLLLLPCAGFAQPKDKPVNVGDNVPAFTLTDQDGKAFNSRREAAKHTLVIYFYPKDESMICTKEACSFRDSFNDFTKAGAIVAGINSGTVASHKSFQQHHKLPFTLLSDPDNKVLNLFGVKSLLSFTGRETFVVDTHGKVVFKYSSMLQGKAHAEQALSYIRNAQER